MIMTEPTRRKASKEPVEQSRDTLSAAPKGKQEQPVPAQAKENQEESVPTVEDEAVLVKRAREGDLVAYDELVQRYQERIYATVYHMTSNHEDANDLAQESFIKAFQALKSFKGGSSFYTWLYRIAVNKTINFLKQRKNRQHMSLNDLDFNAEHDPDLVALISDKTPRRAAGLTELQEKLNAALLKLSDSHRMA